MTAPDQLQDVKLTLAKREPSTHDWDPIQRIALGPAATYAA